LDNQRRAPLGPLSALAESAGGGSALFDFALFPFRRSGIAFFLRQSFSDALFREHPAFEFNGSHDPDPVSLQLPVEPSEGNYYEVGVTKASSTSSNWMPTISAGW
jgi:hypothetical protein